MIPSYQIKIDQKELAPDITGRIQSITVSDEEGMESDSISIDFEDSDGNLALPKRGVRVEVAMGYVGKISPVGAFIVDEVELETGRLSVSGKGFDTDKSLKTMKTRSFKAKKLADVIKKISEENGLQAKVAPDFSATVFAKELVQQNESDLNLLTRLAKSHNAVFKIQGSTLLFALKNSGKTGSGQDLPEVEINVSSEISWNVIFSGRSEYRKVIAKVYDIDTGESIEVVAGEPKGFPVLVLPGQYTDREIAEKEVEEAQNERKEEECKTYVEQEVPEKEKRKLRMKDIWGDLVDLYHQIS